MTDVHHYSLSCSALKASVNDFSEFGYPLYYSEVGAHVIFCPLHSQVAVELIMFTLGLLPQASSY